MGLIQRLYLFTVAGITMVIIVFSLLFWFLGALNNAMEKVDYTQRIGEVVDQLQMHVFERKVNLSYQDSQDWFVDQERFTAVIQTAPMLSSEQQTLHNSIVSQNASLIILFKQIQQVTEKFPKSKIQSHLNARLLTQIEVIREDCLELVANADSSLREVIQKLFYLIAFILITTICGLTWGGISVTRVFKSSINEIQQGIRDVANGHYTEINLSQNSSEFRDFVEKFNAMSKKLSETTVSRDSLQSIVAERTQELLVISNTDELTNIANRRALYERGKIELSRTKRYPVKLALLMIDCDFFKKVNDTYGHSVGDQVLQHLCRTFENVIREIDFLARYGGEEFVLLLPSCNEDGAVEMAKRIQLVLKNTPLMINELNLHVTISIGIAISKDQFTTFEGLLDEADRALFVAKNNGRNRFEVANK
jgi:diguanylate cyclase (GGDEF)-like protein